MSLESRMMNPGNARPFLNYSLFIVRYSLLIIHYFIVLHCYKGKVTSLVSAHVDI